MTNVPGRAGSPMLTTVAKDDHPHASIDWATAAVKDGDLTVALAGDVKQAMVLVKHTLVIEPLDATPAVAPAAPSASRSLPASSSPR